MSRWVVGRPHMFSMFSFAARLARAVLLFVIALLIAVAFPGALKRIEAYLVNRPGLSALGGRDSPGIRAALRPAGRDVYRYPLIPVAAMLLVALFLFGFTVSAAWLGERMPVSQEHKTPVKSVAGGGAILVVVGLLPWIGTAALILAAAISAGATLLSASTHRGSCCLDEWEGAERGRPVALGPGRRRSQEGNGSGGVAGRALPSALVSASPPGLE